MRIWRKIADYVIKEILSLLTNLLVMLEGLNTYLSSVAKSGYKRNAFAPLVWFSVCTVPTLFYFGVQVEEPANYFLFASALIIIFFCLGAYLYMLLKKPSLLQSEGFRLEDKKLDMIYEKGSAPFVVNPIDLTTPLKELTGNDQDR